MLSDAIELPISRRLKWCVPNNTANVYGYNFLLGSYWKLWLWNCYL